MLKIKIPGMMCAHCENAVRNAITKAGGSVTSLDLSTKIVELEASLSNDQLIKILDEVGFDIEFLN
ncbi:MAG: heavy metal-associated domain-containing protein [Synergistaceae bacterium]|nr:heavy metal-associated domain-containing protein [Synergistaceae bacterium]